MKTRCWYREFSNKIHVHYSKFIQTKFMSRRPARSQFFAMLISCSRCSDGSMWLPFWLPLSQIVRLTLK